MGAFPGLGYAFATIVSIRGTKHSAESDLGLSKLLIEKWPSFNKLQSHQRGGCEFKGLKNAPDVNRIICRARPSGERALGGKQEAAVNSLVGP